MHCILKDQMQIANIPNEFVTSDGEHMQTKRFIYASQKCVPSSNAVASTTILYRLIDNGDC